MPALGTISKFHGRHPFVGLCLWKKYVKATGNSITYKEFAAIIDESMAEIQKWVLREPIGFQLPELGNITVNRFKPNKNFKTYFRTTKGAIKNHNLHTGGDAFSIRWFHSSSSYSKRVPYWFFKANRTFNRTLAAVLKAGNSPNFNSFAQDHFITKDFKQCKY